MPAILLLYDRRKGKTMVAAILLLSDEPIRVTDGGYRPDGITSVCCHAGPSQDRSVPSDFFIAGDASRPMLQFGHASILPSAAGRATVLRQPFGTAERRSASVSAVPLSEPRLCNLSRKVDTRSISDDAPRAEEQRAAPAGAQSVTRALDILDAIAERPMLLPELADRVGLSKPTCYRLATALSERGLLATTGRRGYHLGPRLEELAIAWQEQTSAPKNPSSRPHRAGGR
ncbi:helix-turn-helix domain-containing protein [Sphingomonas tagetis]|uniref:helix-turn-helix domain-containing protein n=1 Tax=Sphingomonas tagetis TaxID=2949092 RepID=UPI00345EB41E